MRLYHFQRALTTYIPFYWIPQLLLKVLFLPGIVIQPVQAQDLDPNLLCKRSLLNAQSQFYQAFKQDMITAEDPMQPEIIKFKLNELSGVSEWVRVEVIGSQVKLVHTVVSPSGLAKGLTRFTIVPISHTWHDHVTSRSFFRPKNCESSECLITGNSSVILPTGATIYDGEFILEYTENGWLRTIVFKVPASKAPSKPAPQTIGVSRPTLA